MRETTMEATAVSTTRLRSKKITKFMAISFAIMALMVQLVGGALFPGDAGVAQARTTPDQDHIISGGFSNKNDLLSIYDANKDSWNHRDIQQIYTQYGVSRQDIVNAKDGSFSTNDFNGQLNVLGRQNHGIEGRKAVKINGTNTTIYTGDWLWGYNNKPFTYKALVGKRAVDGKWFAIMYDCGNIVYVEEPKKPEPVKNIKVCETATKKVITIKETEFDSKKHSKNLNDCVVKPVEKNIEVCDLSTKKVVTIKESAYDSAKHSKNLDDCKETPVVVVEEIEVCVVDTKEMTTIKETEFDADKHSTDMKDCEEEEVPVVKNIEVCETATKDIITIKESEFDSTRHSTDIKDCAEEPVTPVTPVTTEPTPPELPRTGVADGISGLLGLGSMIAAAGYYVSSRRNLLSTLLSR